MKPESELIRLVPTKVFVDLLLLLVTLRLTERAARTRELHYSKSTRCLVRVIFVTDWLVRVISVTGLRRAQVKTLLCNRNPVYRAVAWIPICVSVAWSSKLLTYGWFPREAPTIGLLCSLFTFNFHFQWSKGRGDALPAPIASCVCFSPSVTNLFPRPQDTETSAHRSARQIYCLNVV
jgi:hypothetical protein